MKSILIALTAIITLASAAFADSTQDEATAAAKEWLALVDSTDYKLSWESAAVFFKKQVNEKKWLAMIGPRRSSLGEVESRVFLSASYIKRSPGAWKGDHWVIEFKTDFTGKKAAVETVIPMMEEDGTWRVSGYYIK